MAAELEPPELARLVDFAERPRNGDWSLRSALVYYAQGQPERVGRVIELVRRIEFALTKQNKVLDREGPEVWKTFESGAEPEASSVSGVVGLLQAATELDTLADVLVAWVMDRTQGRSAQRPDAAVDDAVSDVARHLDALGIPREERQRPARRGG